jgi:hypothetical protein
VLERTLYDIDRADIQAVTDGSDDGFLYARGFVVAWAGISTVGPVTIYPSAPASVSARSWPGGT